MIRPSPSGSSASNSLRYGSTVRVDIGSVAFGGDGLGRVEGRVVFVPYTAVGDSVDAKVTEVHARHARASSVRVVTPSLVREAAPCPYYMKCGGCQYQHISYAEELRLKTQQVRETLIRIAKISDPRVLDIIPSPQPYGYRNRITVHAEDGRVGFRSPDGRRLVDIEKCMLASAEVNQSLATLRKRRPQAGHYSLRAADIPRSAFHQANQLLLDKFTEAVMALIPRDGDAETGGGERHAGRKAPRLCLELYSGGGFFTEKLSQLTNGAADSTKAPRFTHIWAVEQDERLVRDAVRKKLPGVTLCEGAVEDVLGPLLASSSADRKGGRSSAGFTLSGDASAPEPPSLIPADTLLIADPPREGLSAQALAQIQKHTFAGIVYISCNPATLARDAAKLSTQYTLAVVQPIDMFPRTAQIECISVWEPKTGTR